MLPCINTWPGMQRKNMLYKLGVGYQHSFCSNQVSCFQMLRAWRKLLTRAAANATFILGCTSWNLELLTCSLRDKPQFVMKALSQVCWYGASLAQSSMNVMQGSPTFLKLRATSCVPINCEGLLVWYTLLKYKFCSIDFNYFIIHNRECEDIDHGNVIFRTGPRATYLVLAGDLVSADTTLVTPGVMSLS